MYMFTYIYIYIYIVYILGVWGAASCGPPMPESSKQKYPNPNTKV